MPTLPPAFVKNISQAFPSGSDWLRNLPALLADCARRYDLTLAPEPFLLSFNYVTAAVRNADGQEIVLKVGVPNPEMTTEAAALRFWEGRAAVRLLEADVENGVLLLERLRPGTMLSDLWPDRDDEATEIAAHMMRALWPDAPFSPPADTPFPFVADWARGLSGASPETAPPDLLPRIADAQGIYRDLLAQPPPDGFVLLHGDLHHFNILRSGMSWRAIDPKGVWGDRAYEAGALLRNPWPDLLHCPDPQARTDRRLDILSDSLGIDRERLRLWAFASTVLSAWWGVDASQPGGGDGWRHSAVCADLLQQAR